MQRAWGNVHRRLPKTQTRGRDTIVHFTNSRLLWGQDETLWNQIVGTIREKDDDRTLPIQAQEMLLAHNLLAGGPQVQNLAM